MIPPVIQDYNVIEVDSLQVIERMLKNKRISQDNETVFHIANSGTFLARRDPKHWRVEDSVENFVNEYTPFGDKKLSKILNSRFFKALKNMVKRPPIPYIEFYFTDFRVEESKSMIPVSPCQNELQGEGSILKMQMTGIDRATPHGTIGIPKLLQGVLSGGEAEFETEDENLAMLSLKCTIPHGEMGQIFLRNTAFLYYRLWYRTSIYIQQTSKFNVLSEFKEKGEERSIIKGGMGEWLCATSSMKLLECFRPVQDIMKPEETSVSSAPMPSTNSSLQFNTTKNSNNSLPIAMSPIAPATNSSSLPSDEALAPDLSVAGRLTPSNLTKAFSFASKIKNFEEYLDLKKLKHYRPLRPMRQSPTA